MGDRRALWLLRIGVAGAFIYPAISAFLNPSAWVGYFPSAVLSLPFEETTLLHILGAFEIVLALWILSGKKAAIPNAIAAVVLLVIVATNLPQIDVLFRDISIALAALALAFIEHQRNAASTPLSESPAQ